MPERHPGWVSGINDFEARLASGVMIAAQVIHDPMDPLRVRSGIRDAAGDPGKVTVTGSTVRVNPFQAVIQDVSRPALGPFMATLDAAKEMQLAPSSTTQNRIDLVIAEVDTATDPGFVVRIMQGQAAGSPQPPTVPNPLHLKLAQIQVPPNNAQPVVQDKRQFTAALGGILPVRGPDDMPSVGANGSFLYRQDTGVLHVRRGSAWTPYRPPRQIPTWVSVVFTPQTGWGNYGDPFTSTAYTVTEDGWVHLRGLVKWTGSSTPTDLAKPMFTLPAECRPLRRHLFWVPTAADSKGNPPARLQVSANGDVGGTDATYIQPDPRWTSLDGLSFSTY